MSPCMSCREKVCVPHRSAMKPEGSETLVSRDKNTRMEGCKQGRFSYRETKGVCVLIEVSRTITRYVHLQVCWDAEGE